MKILVIRNLNLKLIEFATDQIAKIVEISKSESPKYILIAGNISRHDKRSIYFAEEIAQATGIKVIYSPGLLEYACVANVDMWISGVLIRLKSNDTKTNVYYPDDIVDDEVQFIHAFGWPTINDTQENLTATVPGRLLIKERISKYMDGEHVSENWPVAFTLEDYTKMNISEPSPIWNSHKKKVLIRAIPNQNDLILNVSYTPQKSFGEDILISSDTTFPKFEMMTI